MAGLILEVDPKKAVQGTELVESGLDSVIKKANMADDALGDISAAGVKSGKGLSVAGKAANDLSKKSGKSSFAMRNLSQQLNQVGQQGAVTGDYLGALAIQMPDILSAFGSWQVILLGAATAIGASLLPAILNTGSAADGMKKELEGLDEIASNLDATTGILTMSVADLAVKFGAASVQIRNMAEGALFLVEQQLDQQLTSLSIGISSMVKEFTKVTTIVNDIGIEETQNLGIQRLTESIGMSAEQAWEFQSAMNQLANAEGLPAVTDASERLLGFMQENNINASDLDEELNSALQQMFQLVKQANALKKEVGDAATNAVVFQNAFISNSRSYDFMLGKPAEKEGEKKPKIKTGRAGGGISSASSVDQLTTSYQNLRSSLDPVYRATMKYEKAQETLEEAVAKGIATQEEANQVLALAKEQYDSVAQSNDEYSQIMDGVYDIFDSTFSQIGRGADNLGDILKNSAKQMLATLWEVMVQQQMMQALFGSFGTTGSLGGIVGSIFGGGGGGGGSLLGGLFGAGAAPAAGGVTVVQTNNFQANGDETVQRIIDENAPKIAQAGAAMGEANVFKKARAGGAARSALQGS